ncbi:serine/threonine-protein phosphatase 2A 56 kDa regulatory subunit delta isoform [Mucor velutinosus]|uniref:Serine/threonine-protein phosphatase 2A 56 kDa regulatory subunit delta isoform n=1 Tax=Mucor velutinosus TaxID=708070 RepID=A0AAN7DQS4_9FUNG|nr:serine/threonine-protein phosphatase 2A 56 kDa regulatory subunit delta isoform [Mucor velutinosus]
MLRATSNSLTKATAWKNTAISSSVRHYTTPNATPAPASNNKEKPSLSQRLGGTGRGKILEGSSDPFASFLANAKKPRNNNNRNGTFTPRNRKPQQSEGQFADAPEQPKQQRPRNENNKNNAKNRNNRQNRQNDKQNVEGAAVDQNNNRRSNKSNNTNRNNAQNGGKKLNLRRSQQPQDIRTRRATTFIDKDIDWASFETATLSTEASETEVAAAEKDSDELVLKDIQGDYGRYIATGSDLKWPPMIEGETLSTLVGSNPTFDLQQKTAFMAAVTKVFNGNAAGAARK